MSIASGIVIFVLTWWAVFFTVLPQGVKSQQEAGKVVPGTEPGAPQESRIGRKLLITTGISVVVWGAVFTVLHYELVTFDTLVAIGKFFTG